MRRQITGKIYRTDDTPWRNTIAKFSRSSSSYTYTTQYPSDSVNCKINEDGELENCYLWCNEEGDSISTYSCEVGRDCFTFSIPMGDGSAIALSVLRAGSNPVESYPQSIIDYIDDSIAGVVAGESKALYSDFLTASQSLSALRIIDLTNTTYASVNNLNQAFVSLGFTHQSINTGASFRAITQGIVSDSSWNWQLDKPIFLGTNGTLTQTFPNGGVFAKTIALPITSQKIFINFGESIIL